MAGRGRGMTLPAWVTAEEQEKKNNPLPIQKVPCFLIIIKFKFNIFFDIQKIAAEPQELNNRYDDAPSRKESKDHESKRSRKSRSRSSDRKHRSQRSRYVAIHIIKIELYYYELFYMNLI
jgi:hypothetical protein